MKKLLALIFLLVVLCILGKCYAQEFQSPNSQTVCYTGSKYSSTITPVGANIEGNTVCYGNNTPRKVPPIDDPFPEPIGDVPVIILIVFLCVYLFWWRKGKGGT